MPTYRNCQKFFPIRVQRFRHSRESGNPVFLDPHQSFAQSARCAAWLSPSSKSADNQTEYQKFLGDGGPGEGTFFLNAASGRNQTLLGFSGQSAGVTSDPPYGARNRPESRRDDR